MKCYSHDNITSTVYPTQGLWEQGCCVSFINLIVWNKEGGEGVLIIIFLGKGGFLERGAYFTMVPEVFLDFSSSREAPNTQLVFSASWFSCSSLIRRKI